MPSGIWGWIYGKGIVEARHCRRKSDRCLGYVYKIVRECKERVQMARTSETTQGAKVLTTDAHGVMKKREQKCF